MNIKSVACVVALMSVTNLALAYDGNGTNQSFSKAKKMLERQVYQDHRETIYCGASFNTKKKISPPQGFTTSKHIKRAKRVEWEHIVPAENFGRAYSEWRDGNTLCVDSKGKSFKGRKCAEKVNSQYRYMQADMFNLFPAIGAVNAMRSNYNFTLLPSVVSEFGSCQMKIDNRKSEPPVSARGRIARTYMYMDTTYPKYAMSKQQRQLMNSWDKTYPVSRWECERVKRIQTLQKNQNPITQSRCEAAGLWSK